MIKFHWQCYFSEEFFLVLFLFENSRGFNDFCSSKKTSIFHFDFANGTICSSSNLFDEDIIFEIGFLLNFGEGIPFNRNLIKCLLDSFILFVILIILIFFIDFPLFITLTFSCLSWAFHLFRAIGRLWWFLIHCILDFYRDRSLEWDWLDIEELNFLWEVLLAVSLQFICFLLNELWFRVSCLINNLGSNWFLIC